MIPDHIFCEHGVPRNLCDQCRPVRTGVRLHLIAGIAALALAGCADLPRAAPREIAWQALNVADIGQTVTIARRPDRWQEVNPVTRSLIGAHPSEGNVYAVMAAYSVAHLAVSMWLDSNDPGSGPWHVASIAWSFATITDKGFAVGRNAYIGIEPWGPHHE